MSYILDALRKADAQRERDPARGIHAQPVREPLADPAVRRGYRFGLWLAGAAGLVAIASAGWYLSRGSAPGRVAPPPAEVALVAPPAVVVAPPVSTPAAAVMPPPPPVVIAPPAAPVKSPPAASPPAAAAAVKAPPAAMTAPVAKPAEAPAQSFAAASTPRISATIRTAPTQPLAPASAPVAVAAAAVAEPPPIAGLPADAPKLAISGGVYSANAAQRMLIVNGQVFNEGGEVSAGVVLEEIKPKAAILRFRGSRYTVGF
jgi:general secretion pathway protein B